MGVRVCVWVRVPDSARGLALFSVQANMLLRVKSGEADRIEGSAVHNLWGCWASQASHWALCWVCRRAYAQWSDPLNAFKCITAGNGRTHGNATENEAGN